MNNRRLIQLSKLISVIFSPLFAQLWAFFWMFKFSYLCVLPTEYKIYIFILVAFTTVIVPYLGIDMIRIMMKWTHLQMSHREHRHLPYVLTLLSYTACLYIMSENRVPMFLRGVVLSALVAQLVCVIMNAFWKISTHMVGMGGLVGALTSFILLFRFNALFLLCSLIIISGAVGSARITLRQHSVSQVFGGFFIGFICSLVFITVSWF